MEREVVYLRHMDFLTEEEKLYIAELKTRMDETDDKIDFDLYREKIVSLYDKAKLRCLQHIQELEKNNLHHECI